MVPLESKLSWTLSKYLWVTSKNQSTVKRKEKTLISSFLLNLYPIFTSSEFTVQTNSRGKSGTEASENMKLTVVCISLRQTPVFPKNLLMLHRTDMDQISIYNYTKHIMNDRVRKTKRLLP